MHPNSRLLFERYALPYFEPGQKVLEIGPDSVPSTYQRLAGYETSDWLTVDLDYQTPNVRPYSADGNPVDHVMEDDSRLPFADGSFDVVVSGQVLEHVRRIWSWFEEVARVTKPGGNVVTICPVSWPYHEAPVDCWRIYPEGMRALCEASGLVVLLSTFEALEPHLSSRTYAAATHRWNEEPTALSNLKDKVRKLVGWPTPVAVDTITIARKSELGQQGSDRLLLES